MFTTQAYDRDNERPVDQRRVPRKLRRLQWRRVLVVQLPRLLRLVWRECGPWRDRGLQLGSESWTDQTADFTNVAAVQVPRQQSADRPRVTFKQFANSGGACSLYSSLLRFSALMLCYIVCFSLSVVRPSATLISCGRTVRLVRRALALWSRNTGILVDEKQSHSHT